jgi:hypothetical protein
VLVYRAARQVIDPQAMLRPLASQIVDALQHVSPPRDEVVTMLIDAGSVAAAVADAEERDGHDAASPQLMELVVALAASADAAWRHDASAVTRALNLALQHAAAARALRLPAAAEAGVAEGFAYYALGPELYADTARRWGRKTRPHVVWCLGLRTIGVTLAASVVAALRAEGIEAHALSVRPWGHPFDRRVTIDLPQGVRPGAWWLVVDEGPGLSGSSIAGAAAALAQHGIDDQRIVLMPAHRPDTGHFAEATQQRWARHEVWPVDFEKTWLTSRRLADHWHASTLDDISAGAWRHRVTLNGPTPAVHPQHERRKFLMSRGPERAFLKFTGYGTYGKRYAAYAEDAAQHGWSPSLVAVRDGWAEYAWRSDSFGIPAVSDDVIDQLAEYVAFVAGTREVGDSDVDAIREMAIINTRAACGDAAAQAVERLCVVEPCRAVHIDGRFRPHEWYVSGGRLQKTDGVEHGNDHFFPGPTDIAWDIAGAIEEWHLNDAQARQFQRRYAQCASDRTVEARLPFFHAAYLACRAGYTAFGATQVSDVDRDRFVHEHAYYRHRLASVLGVAHETRQIRSATTQAPTC